MVGAAQLWRPFFLALGRLLIVVVSVSLLFVDLVSFALVSVAVFDAVPALLALTTTVTVAAAPAFTWPMSQATLLPVFVQVPFDDVDEMKFTCPGNVSVTKTPAAS